MTQQLNRILTVNAESTVTRVTLTIYRYTRLTSRALGLGDGEWDSPVSVGSGDMFSDLAAATEMTIADADSRRQTTPRPSAVVAAGGKIHLLGNTSGAPVVTWTIQSWAEVMDLDGHPVGITYTFTGAGELVGPDEAIPADNPQIRLGFDGQGVSVPVTTVVGRKVWGRITERGSEAGLLTVGLSTVEATQEAATFRIRYDPDLANGVGVTDDLGRAWQVTSSRSIGDREFLVFEAFRNIRATG